MCTIGQEQIGFVKYIWIKNAIFKLRVILEQALLMQRHWYLRFKDGVNNIDWRFISTSFWFLICLYTILTANQTRYSSLIYYLTHNSLKNLSARKHNIFVWKLKLAGKFNFSHYDWYEFSFYIFVSYMPLPLMMFSINALPNILSFFVLNDIICHWTILPKFVLLSLYKRTLSI